MTDQTEHVDCPKEAKPRDFQLSTFIVDLSRARFGLLAYMSRGMLSPTLHRTAIPNLAALTLREPLNSTAAE